MAMEIVYVDPGYGRLMLPDADVFESVENTTFNSTSGVAFTSKGAYTRIFPDIDLSFDPPGTAQIYKKVWSAKVTAYGNSSGLFSLGVYENTSSSAVHLGMDIRSSAYNWYTYDGKTTTGIPQGGVSGGGPFSSEGAHNLSVTFSFTANQKTSVTEYTVANTLILDDKVKSVTNTTTTKPNLEGIFGLHFGYSHKVYVSNVLVGVATYAGDGTGIPSDDGIPVDTMIHRLSLGTPVTDFTLDSDTGEYIANASGQDLLQTILTSTGTQTVNHLVVYGNPGYCVGSRVTKATGISRPSGGSITPHGTHTLSAAQDMHVCDFWKIGDTTLSNLYGLQVGWRAGG